MSLAQIFQKLESTQAQQLEVASGHASPFSFRDSQTRLARAKNRYSDIVPFDRNRVKLRDAQVKFSGEDYINASLIECPDNRCYIASQGPLDSTAADFWQMIWQDSSVVVMLCNVKENGRPKCAQYWPETVNEPRTYKSSAGSLDRSFTVTSLESSYNEAADTQVTAIRLVNDAQQTSKEITHLRFCSWPDYGIADLTKLEALVDLVEKHRQASKAPEMPVLHCSAGCGRTGTLIALSVIQDKPRLDPAELVANLRRQRVSMVQAFGQFELLYKYQSLLTESR